MNKAITEHVCACGRAIRGNSYWLHAAACGNWKRYPHAESGQGRGYAHRRVAEKALGRPLPPSAVVHHHNEDKGDFSNRNLVICEDEAYHKLLHRRMKLLALGGDPNTQKQCPKCGRILLVVEFSVASKTGRIDSYCRPCKSVYMEAWRRQQTGATQ